MKELQEAINKILWKNKPISRKWEDIKKAIEDKSLTISELRELKRLFKEAERKFPNGFDSFNVVGVNPLVCIMVLDQRINNYDGFITFDERAERPYQEKDIVDNNTEARAKAVIDDDFGDYYEQQAYEAEQEENRKEQEYLRELREAQEEFDNLEIMPVKTVEQRRRSNELEKRVKELEKIVSDLSIRVNELEQQNHQQAQILQLPK